MVLIKNCAFQKFRFRI